MTAPSTPAPTSDACGVCGNRGVDPWHRSRCAYLADLKARVTERADQYGVAHILALDLFAHLRQSGDDGTQAMHHALLVMDLGWRPTVGAQP